MSIVKMSRAQLADKLQKLWIAHESAVAQRLEARDREALDKLAKALNMPRHVRTVLDWALARTTEGHSPEEVKAWDQAYDAAEGYVKACLDALKSTAVYDYSENRRSTARCEGACAGYYFRALELHGVGQ